MPTYVKPSSVVPSKNYRIRTRQKVGLEEQANETYQVTSVEGVPPLGRGGETNGIAKREIQDLRLEWYAQLEQSVGEAQQAILQMVEKHDRILQSQAPEDVERHQESRQVKQLGEMILRRDNFTVLSEFQRFPEEERTEVLKRFVGVEMALANSTGNLMSADVLCSGTLGLTEPDENTLKDRFHMLSRAVASSRVSDLLQINVLSEEKFALDEQGRAIGVSIGVDGVGVTGNLPNNKLYFLNVDYSNPEIQRGLYDLEALDYITGQIDRHTGNIFVDPETGKVRGIDNDMAFPERPRERLVKGAEIASRAVGNLPLFMHAETARKIESITPEQLRETLQSVHYPGDPNSGRLTDAEIDGAVTRLEEMQRHVQTLRGQGRVVEAFDQNTYAAVIQHQMGTLRAQYPDKPTSELSDRELGICRISSYLGAVEINKMRNEIAVREGVAESIDSEGVKAHGLSNKAKLDEHYRQRLDERIQYCEKRLQKLENPSLWTMIKSLRYGGVEGAKEAFGEKLNEAQSALGELKAQRPEQFPGEGLKGPEQLQREPLGEKLGVQIERSVSTREAMNLSRGTLHEVDGELESLSKGHDQEKPNGQKVGEMIERKQGESVGAGGIKR
jgi:hypothetical protein